LLTFKIPEFGKLLDGQVTFGDTIINAVSFEVSVDGVPQHPYYFDQPIEVTIPYKRGLLDNLGIQPEDLGMYFVSENGEYTDEGITDITVDETSNLITGKVIHFSDIALVPVADVPTKVQENNTPETYVLRRNYPNPFNPTTTIGFVIPVSGKVTLTIYNIAGQNIRTLIDESMSSGVHSVVWDGLTDEGIRAPSGVYLYELRTGNFHDAKKLLLMK